MRRISISLPSMHRRDRHEFQRDVVHAARNAETSIMQVGLGFAGNQFSKTEFRFSLTQQISRETNDRQYKKQFGKVRGHSSNINGDSDQPLALPAAEYSCSERMVSYSFCSVTWLDGKVSSDNPVPYCVNLQSSRHSRPVGNWRPPVAGSHGDPEPQPNREARAHAPGLRLSDLG